MQDGKLFHTVFFELKDSSEAAVGAFIEDCKTYLAPNPGILSFSVGRRVEDHLRDVNVLDFHVSLHILFESKKHHDNYQLAADHNTFVERNKDNWAAVRVYDSYVV